MELVGFGYWDVDLHPQRFSDMGRQTKFTLTLHPSLLAGFCFKPHLPDPQISFRLSALLIQRR